jgi:hypothetical protein
LVVDCTVYILKPHNYLPCVGHEGGFLAKRKLTIHGHGIEGFPLRGEPILPANRTMNYAGVVKCAPAGGRFWASGSVACPFLQPFAKSIFNCINHGFLHGLFRNNGGKSRLGRVSGGA